MSETHDISLNLSALTDIAEEVHAVAVEKGWYEDDLGSFPEKIALVHSELSEALEDYRSNKSPTEIWYEESGKPCGISVELADALIRILDMCAYFDIPIADAMAQKIAYNMGREHRHGGKRA